MIKTNINQGKNQYKLFSSLSKNIRKPIIIDNVNSPTAEYPNHLIQNLKCFLNKKDFLFSHQ